MPSLKHAIAFAALTATMTARADCVSPEAPAAVDGTSATMEQMVGAQSAVKAFQAANADYLACMDSRLAELKDRGESGDAGAAAEFTVMTEAYNAAVALEEQVAGDFNDAIKAFKAASN